MFSTSYNFIGIDPTAGDKPIIYAALDEHLRLTALGKGTVDEVLAFCAGQLRGMVAVCAPRRTNQGLMNKPSIRQSLSPPPRPGRWINFRVADYILRQRNITTPQIYLDESDCPNWMRVGFRLYRRLDEMGYKEFPSAGSERQSLEVYPHASYTVLLGHLPFAKNSLEGRLQRQLLLNEAGVKVDDPMRIFEEFTRYRILKGMIPIEKLHTPGELDALVAAYTAWIAAYRSEQITLIGEKEEGQIVLPVPELKERYWLVSQNIS